MLLFNLLKGLLKMKKSNIEKFTTDTIYLNLLKYHQETLLNIQIKVDIKPARYEDTFNILPNKLNSLLKDCKTLSLFYNATCTIIINNGQEVYRFE